MPIARIIRKTVAEIEPHARDLGSERELEGIGDILGRGSSAERQLRVYNANHDIVEVAREIADATEALPVPASPPSAPRTSSCRPPPRSRSASHGELAAATSEPQPEGHLLSRPSSSGRSMQNALARSVSSACTNGSFFGRA